MILALLLPLTLLLIYQLVQDTFSSYSLSLSFSCFSFRLKSLWLSTHYSRFARLFLFPLTPPLFYINRHIFFTPSLLVPLSLSPSLHTAHLIRNLWPLCSMKYCDRREQNVLRFVQSKKQGRSFQLHCSRDPRKARALFVRITWSRQVNYRRNR